MPIGVKTHPKDKSVCHYNSAAIRIELALGETVSLSYAKKLRWTTDSIHITQMADILGSLCVGVATRGAANGRSFLAVVDLIECHGIQSRMTRIQMHNRHIPISDTRSSYAPSHV